MSLAVPTTRADTTDRVVAMVWFNVQPYGVTLELKGGYAFATFSVDILVLSMYDVVHATCNLGLV